MSSGRASPSLTEEDSIGSASQLPRLRGLRKSSSIGTLNGSNPPIRRSSTSRARKLSRASTESLRFDHPNLPTITETTANDDRIDEEASSWHAFSLIFVAIPAISGLFFENGGAIATDILLLGLGCVFLYWSVKWPWQWYHAAQGKIYVDYDVDYLANDEDFDAIGNPLQEEEVLEQDVAPENIPSNGQKQQKAGDVQQRRKQEQAAHSLQRYEILALFWCFIMPTAVAWLLHILRPYLSRPSGGLVSNSNLTLFVLAAEIRPVFHVFKLIDARTLHLQKIVATPEPEESSNNDSPANNELISQILERLEAAETRLAETTAGAERARANYSSDKSGVSSPTLTSNSNVQSHSATAAAAALAAAGSATQTIQPQLDALNRAVRRYEKRQSMQSVIIDARLRDLDSRVGDALSLAAAASRMSQKQSLVSWALETIHVTITRIWQTMYSVALLPWKVTHQVYMYLLGPRRKKHSKGKASSGKWEYEKLKRINADNR